jgi:hypothetical protein
MRLVITAGPPDIWVGAGAGDRDGLRGMRRPGEWTNGHGADAIVRLQALATRLGFPVTLGDAADLALTPNEAGPWDR